MTKSALTVVVSDACGLHLRVAADLARTASRFAAEIRVETGSLAVDGKSLLALLTLGAAAGTRLTVTGSGKDAAEAVEAFAAAFNPRSEAARQRWSCR